MNITLSQEQYRTLLLMVYLGDWMVNAHKTEPDRTFGNLEHYIFSFAEAFGVQGLVEWFEDEKKHYATQDMDDLAEPYIEEYDNETFWDELIDRLADRDFLAEYGQDAIEKMTPEERLIKREEFVERYEEEFVEQGLDRVTISEGSKNFG